MKLLNLCSVKKWDFFLLDQMKVLHKLRMAHKSALSPTFAAWWAGSVSITCHLVEAGGQKIKYTSRLLKSKMRLWKNGKFILNKVLFFIIAIKKLQATDFNDFWPPRHYFSALHLRGHRFIFVANQPHGTGILIMRQSESVFILSNPIFYHALFRLSCRTESKCT